MDKLCLDWDGFKENIETNFAKFRQNEDLTDVTLVCEDGTQLVGHRLVLAASSLFFQNILGMKKVNQSLLILMRGVKPEDMSCLLDFMYCGKVDVKQENLEGFLKLAKELEVRGLFDVEGEEGNNDTHRIFSKTMTKNEASHDSKTNVLSSKKCSSPNAFRGSRAAGGSSEDNDGEKRKQDQQRKRSDDQSVHLQSLRERRL